MEDWEYDEYLPPDVRPRMDDWEYDEYLPPDVRPRMDGHRRSHWNHMANPYTFYKTPYSNYDSRVYTWAGPINPNLYSQSLNALTHETEANLCRLTLQMTQNDQPCKEYGLKHWHPDAKSKRAQQARESSSKSQPIPTSTSWQNRDVVFASSECLDRPWDRSLPVTAKAPRDEDECSSLAGPFNKYCYLCSTKEEHKKHQLKMQKKKSFNQKLPPKPRIMYIAPPPTVRKKKVEDKPKDDNYDISYRVVVTTGSTAKSGTDANVLISIKGSNGVLKKTQLRKSRAGFAFCQKTSEVFYIRGPKLGDMEYLTVEHDGVEKEQGWFLEKIQVTNMKTRQTFVFKCKQWLSLFEGDQLVKRKLKAEEKETEIKDYKVSVLTGSKKFAGTDSNVCITLYGRKGVSPKLKLQDKTKNLFERGQTDLFSLSVEDIGPLTKVRIEHDGTGVSAGWFLENVRIVDREDKTKNYFFPCHDWLARDEGNGELWRDIVARSEREGDSASPEKKAKGYPTVPYEMEIHTGNAWMSGTNANVFLQIFGKLGKTKQIDLTPEDCLNHSDPFENSQVDNFQYDLKDVGRLKKITIGHDNSGIGAGWFLGKVVIRRFLTSAEMKEWVDKEMAARQSVITKEQEKERRQKRGKKKDSDKDECSDSNHGSEDDEDDTKVKRKEKRKPKDDDDDGSENEKKDKKKKKKMFGHFQSSDSDSSDSENDKKKKKRKDDDSSDETHKSKDKTVSTKEKMKKRSKKDAKSDDEKLSSKSKTVSTKEKMKKKAKKHAESDSDSDSDKQVKQMKRNGKKQGKKSDKDSDVSNNDQKKSNKKGSNDFNLFGSLRRKSKVQISDEEKSKGKAGERPNNKKKGKKSNNSESDEDSFRKTNKKKKQLKGKKNLSEDSGDSDEEETSHKTLKKKLKGVKKYKGDSEDSDLEYKKGNPKRHGKGYFEDSSEESEATQESSDDDDSSGREKKKKLKNKRRPKNLPKKVPYSDEYEFECNKWLADDEGDGQLVVTLTPCRKTTLFKLT